MAERTLNAVVVQRSELAPGLMILRVVPQGWDLPAFVPGQFAVLGLPWSAPRVAGADAEEDPEAPERIITRAYSIASSSLAGEYLEFYITLLHSGALTPRLFALNIGEPLFLGPKITGRFTLEAVPDDANIVMLSTGTGIAPYMSMLRTMLSQETRQRIAVVHGARHSWDLGYADELRSLERLAPALTYLPIISRPQAEPVPWRGLTGYVQDVWQQGVIASNWGETPTPADTHVLLCGNPSMIETMEKLLQAEGFAEHKRRAPGQYHLERYW